MDVSTLDDGVIFLSDGTNLIPCTLTFPDAEADPYDPSTVYARTAVLTPTDGTRLRPLTEYTVTVAESARAYNGKPLSGSASGQTSFQSDDSYTVRFVDYDGSLISEAEYAYGDEVLVPSDPFRESDSVYAYTFAGWAPQVVTVSGDATYTATYTSTCIDYTVKFVDWDGRTISEKTYHYGDAVTVPENPTRQADETNTYTFSGWDREITTVKGDVTYTATYTTEANVYTVTFKNDDGTTILIATYHYGDEVVLPSNPVKAEDESYTYTFTGWTPSVTLVFGDATYTATYRADPKTPETVEVKLDTANGGQNGETTILIPSDGKNTLSKISSTTAAPDYIPGDVNGDGDIDGRDYIVVKKFVLDTVDFTERQQQIADINGDGEVDTQTLKRQR